MIETRRLKNVSVIFFQYFISMFRLSNKTDSHNIINVYIYAQSAKGVE